MLQVLKVSFISLILVISISCYSQTQPSISPIEGLGINNISLKFGVTGLVNDTIQKSHNGIDFYIKTGTPVRTTADGTVIAARITQKHYRMFIKIQHQNGYETLYAHLSKIVVKRGQSVKQGDLIGYSGQSGLTSTPILHYEVRKDGKNVDPTEYILESQKIENKNLLPDKNQNNKEICTEFYSPFNDFDRRKYVSIKNRIISKYGEYRSSPMAGHKHSGIDLQGEYGELVHAIGIGTVVEIFRGFPNLTVIIKHYTSNNDSIYSEYIHVEDIGVKIGDRVDHNTAIGRLFIEEELKKSNFGTSSHLHLEIRKRIDDNGTASWRSMTITDLDKYCINPLEFLEKYLQ